MRISDWSSDVCSSDLHGIRGLGSGRRGKVKKAAIIGAGIGGLALAIRLQSAGIATTVIEGRDRPGGRAYVWEKDGLTFDAGPTVITDPRSEEHTSELQSLMRISYAVSCLKKKNTYNPQQIP